MKKTCLIVDDSELIRKLARSMLEELGFSCADAGNGQLALDSCKNKMPSVVLLDWNMPVMNGLDFVKKLRQMPEAKGTKVVFCTTESDASSIRKALDAGADEYIIKPFDREILRGKFEYIGVL